MRAPLLALLGLLVAAGPALAARGTDRGAAAQPRAKVAAPAQTSAGKPARATPTRSVATRPAAVARNAAPGRASAGRATAGRGQAVAQRGRAGQHATASIGGRHGMSYAMASPATACRGSARNCRITRVSAPQPMRWSQGLSPALNVQASNCPAGTMATLATGHSNVVRCMPI